MPVARRRLSADSKLLAAGGALAAAMLLVAVGVLLGQHSTTTSPAAATPGAYPVVVEAKAPTAAAALPPAATALPVEARPAPGPVVEKVDGPTTVDVQQLPSAPKPRKGFRSQRSARWQVSSPTLPKRVPVRERQRCGALAVRTPNSPTFRALMADNHMRW